jgi:hypothetical protein
MALSLGVKQGSQISVGGKIVQVKSLTPPSYIVVSVDGGNDIVVSEETRQEILPDVFVMTAGPDTSRLVFQAPKHIPIVRVKNGRSSHEDKLESPAGHR